MRRSLIRGARPRSLALLTLLVSLLVTTLIAPLAARADDDAVKGKTFVIATDTTFAPFEYRDEAGNMTGIDIDLIQTIAERKGFTVDIKAVGFDAALQAVQSKQADGVIAGMSITDERKAVFDFSDPYFDSGVQMAVKDGSDITDYSGLKGSTVVAKTGTEGLAFAQSIADQYGFTVKALDKADTMYSEVTSGNASAVFDDYPVLAYGVSQGNGLKIVTDKEQGSSYGFAVLKGDNADLLGAFNSGLAELRQDGTYHDILTKYLGDNAPADEATQTQVEGVKGKTFTIATDTTFAPFEYRDEAGNMTGIDIDLLNEIAERQGFTVDIKAVGFDAALQAVQAKQADGVIAGMSITDERKEIFDFSDPYFSSGVQMAVGKDSDITGYEDLKGKTVVAKTGTEGLAFAQSIADQYGFKVKALDKADTMYSEVSSGNAAAVFDDYPVLAYGVSQGNGLKIVTDKEKGSSYGFAVLKGDNADLLAAFDAGLAELRSDGTYHDILVKYLGDNAPADPTEQVEGVKGKTFTVATDTTFAPFEYRDEAGNMTGIDIDLLNEIAKRQNFKVDIKAVGFDAALQAVQSKQADGVIAGMSITEEREKIFDFSDPYFDSGVQMAVSASDDTTKSYADLKGKTVVAKTGTEGLAFAQSIAEENGFTVKALDKADTMYSEVATGNAVAVFDDYPVLAYGISQGNGLKIVTEKEQGSSYGFAVLKGDNADLIKAFNAGLQSMKDDGTYAKVMDKYLATGDEAAETTSLGFWGLLAQSFPALMKGLGMTLAATALSLLFASILGVVFGFFKVSGVAILNFIASAYVDIFRGTPLLVQAFFFYFGLPAATGLKIDVFVAGVLTLSLNAGAYMTEIVRGGIQNVDPGQLEASRSLGLNWMQSMRKIIVPQALKIMTPSAINQFVITLKDTSLLAVLGFAELTYQGQQIIARNFRSFEMWLIIGAIYFIVIFALTKLSNALDRRINK